MRRNARRIVLPVAMLLLSARPALSDIPNPPPPTNILYGFINSNSTLTVASPGPIYYVVGDLIVNPGVTLTIQPGVTVRFAANRDTLGGGDYPTLTELRVRGHLVAQGSEADSIRLLSTNDGFAEWGHIRVESGATAAMRYVVLKGAYVGLYYLSSGPLALADMLVRDCATAMNVVDGTFTARWINVGNCTNGLLMFGISGSVQTCTLSGTGTANGTGLAFGPGVDTTPPDTGIVVPTIVSEFASGVATYSASVRNILSLRNAIGFRDDGGSVINYCTAVQNAQGFSLRGTLQNSIAAYNGTGILNTGCYGALVDFVDSWANTNQNLQHNCTLMSVYHFESFNPFFMNPAADNFRLAEGSIFESYSSTGGQIGAYGPHRGPNVVDAPAGGPSLNGLTVTVTPNPSRGRTVFACRLPKPGPATADVIDLSGRKVSELRSTANQSGMVSFQWDGLDARGSVAMPGMYYWRVMAAGAIATGRLVLIK